MAEVPLFPTRASTIAGSVDRLYWFLIGVSAFFSLLIAGLVIGFSARYRRARRGPRGRPIEGALNLELAWTLIPLSLTMVMFTWGAALYFEAARPPADAVPFALTAKQWMWRFQHPTGQREIDELHVPVNTPIALTMTSEDVIHSFFVPAFRIKQDVLPDRYTTAWFEATRVGRFDLFCAEYCGAKHSAMRGTIVVMEPENYERWLEGRVAGETPAEAGARLFAVLRCNTCHAAGAEQRGPRLDGLFGTEVEVQGGATVVFDSGYVRESILEPRAKITTGFEPVMPTYRGQVTEGDIMDLTTYLRSLAAARKTGR